MTSDLIIIDQLNIANKILERLVQNHVITPKVVIHNVALAENGEIQQMEYDVHTSFKDSQEMFKRKKQAAAKTGNLAHMRDVKKNEDRVKKQLAEVLSNTNKSREDE